MVTPAGPLVAQEAMGIAEEGAPDDACKNCDDCGQYTKGLETGELRVYSGLCIVDTGEANAHVRPHHQ